MWSLLLALPSFADASNWYLESPESADKASAATAQQAASAAGEEARVVRRFVDGQGWRFVVRVEGFDDAGRAEQVGRALATTSGVPFTLFSIEGATAVRVATFDTPPSAPMAPVVVATATVETAVVAPVVVDAPKKARASERAPGAVSAELPDATVDLEAVVASHGIEGFAEAAQAGPLLLRYRRTLPDGRQIEHVWATRPGATYLEVSGNGGLPTSRILVTSDRAWLSVGGGAWAEQNIDKTRTLVDDLGPLRILPMILALGEAVDGRREFERMVVAGGGAIDGVDTLRLLFPGDATSAPLELEVGARDHLVRAVRFENGALVHEFSGYGSSTVTGLQGAGSASDRLPARVVTRREGVVTDTVEIEVLDLRPKLPETWFSTPS